MLVCHQQIDLRTSIIITERDLFYARHAPGTAPHRCLSGKGRAGRSGASCSQPPAEAFPGDCAGSAGTRHSGLRKKLRAEDSSPGWLSCSSSDCSSSEKADAKVSKPEQAAASKRAPSKRVLNRGTTRDGASAVSTAAKRSHRNSPVSPRAGAAAGHSMDKAADPAGPTGNSSFATRSCARRLRSSGGGTAASGVSDDGKAFEEPNRGGDSGGRGGRNLTLEPAIDLALSGDDDDCLVDTDSDAGSHDSQLVLCRCGGRDSKDGSCWISCDGRGCRRWEHLRCAYPERAAAAEEGGGEDDEGGEEKPPETHFCDRCKANGSAAGMGFSGGSSLSRGGGSMAAEPSSRSPSIGFSPSKRMAREGSVANGSDVEVRRSRRVMSREGIRTLLRKNVVGSEVSNTPSCSDDADAAGGSDSGVGACLGGGINDSDEDDSDSFWAPEGQVEASEEYRCRCGATHEDEGVIGTPKRGVVDVDGDSAGGGSRWMQCRSDSCGIWEHAACCEHGCSAGATPGSPVTAANRKHWCRSCDPKGKKHAR